MVHGMVLSGSGQIPVREARGSRAARRGHLGDRRGEGGLFRGDARKRRLIADAGQDGVVGWRSLRPCNCGIGGDKGLAEVGKAVCGRRPICGGRRADRPRRSFAERRYRGAPASHEVVMGALASRGEHRSRYPKRWSEGGEAGRVSAESGPKGSRPPPSQRDPPRWTRNTHRSPSSRLDVSVRYPRSLRGHQLPRPATLHTRVRPPTVIASTLMGRPEGTRARCVAFPGRRRSTRANHDGASA